MALDEEKRRLAGDSNPADVPGARGRYRVRLALRVWDQSLYVPAIVRSRL